MEPDKNSSTESSIGPHSQSDLPDRLHTIGKRAGISAVGGLVGGAVISQTAAAQEGLQAAGDAICVGQVASLASLAYYGVALATILYGLITFVSPKTNNSMSKKQARSNQVQGAAMMALGICAGAIPVILAGLGLVDVTSCIAPGNIGN